MPPPGLVTQAYRSAGVDTEGAGRAVDQLVSILRRIPSPRSDRAGVPSGHYAAVLAINDELGIAICTDGVGTKALIAAELQRFTKIGIDCIAMNVNDLICVGADPTALVDYIAVEIPDEDMLGDIATGLVEGALQSGIEIPGGEVAQLQDMLRPHKGKGFDLVGTSIGTVNLDQTITGREVQPGDAIIGLASSGIHANGLTLARKALIDEGPFSFDDILPGLEESLGDELLRPTTIYVKAVEELRRSLEVRGLAHITSNGLSNLLRLNTAVGYEIDDPMPVPAIFDLIEKHGEVSRAEMYWVFNMGIGFCCIVPPSEAAAACDILQSLHPTKIIGQITEDHPGEVLLNHESLIGNSGGFRPVDDS